MSITISSLAAFVIGRLLQSTGIVADDSAIAHFIEVTLQIAGAIGVWYGRYRKGDIKWWGGRIS